MDRSKGRGSKSPAKDGSETNQPRGPVCKDCGNDIQPAICLRHDNYERCVQQNCGAQRNLRCDKCIQEIMELPDRLRCGATTSGCPVVQVQLQCMVCFDKVPPQPCSEHENIMRCHQANCIRQQNIRCERCKRENRNRHGYDYGKN